MMADLELESVHRLSTVRAGRDRALSGVRRMFDRLPLRVIPAVLELTAFASYTLNLDLRWAGVPRDGRVAVEHTMKLCATFDHRVLDGAHAAAMADTLRAWIEEPLAPHFGPIPDRVPPRTIPSGAPCAIPA